MFDRNDPSILWVANADRDGGQGTFESPFSSPERALAVAQPGRTVVLRPGVYDRSVTFEISGSPHKPVVVAAEDPFSVEVRGVCWFFYDVCDCIVTGLTFKDAPMGALAMIGACSRNRLDNIRFINCGASEKSSCALFFGGSGGSCNVVENCRFEHEPAAPRCERPAGVMSVGLMVSEGDSDHGAPITDHVFRRNAFINCDYGICIGAGDAPDGQYGHIVEYNTIVNPGIEGILVKCGDTQVRGNLVQGSPRNSISIAAGKNSVIEANRIIDCASGIGVSGDGHTVSNNCLIRCRAHAVDARGPSEGGKVPAATNLFIEDNTCIACGTPPNGGAADAPARIAGIRIDPGASCIIRHNLFFGPGVPYVSGGGGAGVLVKDNAAAGGCETRPGVAAAEVAFKEPARDDYTNDSGFGASGWMLRPEAIDPRIDEIDEKDDYRAVNFDEGDDEISNSGVAETEEFESFMERFYLEDIDKQKE
jgi:hypothetical protein